MSFDLAALPSPWHAGLSDRARESLPAATAALAPLRVLVVDDNQEAAEGLAAMLSLLGHDVHVCHDGGQALRAGAALQPDLVFLDIGLPVLSGYDVARQLAGGVCQRPPCLVAITGFGQADHQTLAGAAGFAHHLVKPFMPAQLQALLAEIARVPRDTA